MREGTRRLRNDGEHAELDAAFAGLLDNKTVHAVVAELDGQLVGIAHYLFHQTVWAQKACYLQDLFVPAAQRGRGIARALIEAVADRARVAGADRYYWTTKADNTTACVLYDKVAVHRGFIRYDYYYGGFPPHTYQIHYAAPGAPELAHQVKQLIEDAGLPSAVDAERGFDHGVFAPMAVMYPKADVPLVQLSLRRGLDPGEHMALGRAIAPLRDENVLIVGSGLSFHNLRNFGPQARAPSRAFDDWLAHTMLQTPPAERSANLVNWAAAPAARLAHPREEHLIPLMVAVGAAEADAAMRVYYENDFMGGLTVSSFRFG